MNEVSLRKASLSDKITLLALEQKVLEAERPFNSTIKMEGAHYYDLHSLLTNDKSHLIVAELGANEHSGIIGTGYIDIRRSKQSFIHEYHGYLGFMYVDSEYRGLGVNRKIMDALINWGKKQGVSDFYLDVYAENQAAVRAYEKAGFVASMVEMKLSVNSKID
ncbi:MAG: GNAT family N-acetyltransferase [Pseudomonadales bacterium]